MQLVGFLQIIIQPQTEFVATLTGGNAPDKQTANNKISAFTEMLTFADDQVLKCI